MFAGCLDPFAPPKSTESPDLLVVDGFINSGDGSVDVKLSNAIPLDAKKGTKSPLSNAEVFVETEDGTRVAISETSPGQYKALSSQIVTGKKYNLYIKTPHGEEYRSDPVELRKPPALDSVTWRPNDDGITVYVDAHDDSGLTQYYQWTFTETWEYHTAFTSIWWWDKENAVVHARGNDTWVHICYASSTSTRVLISKTDQNVKDVVNDYPLAVIKQRSKKLLWGYSILVQQRALDEAAYLYWNGLQKTTENLGSIFDPMPAKVVGNIHNVNDESEPVLGYFSGGEVQEKRMSLLNRDLPPHLRFVIKERPCEEKVIAVEDLPMYKGVDLYISGDFGRPKITHYIVTVDSCVDCRFRGGTLVRPSYWPD